jgi:DNA topoisomerase-2
LFCFDSYTKKTQLEHILLRPDTYIGSVEKQTQQMWVFEQETSQIVNKNITYVPGLYKIFDEIIVNAADNKQRDSSMSRIEVTIKPEDNSIRVWNNGNGIPVVIHQEHKIYVPELIFGNLLTGSNFDDKEEKTTGGRNGYGAKLANIFSRRFIVETADKTRNLKYKQEFANNMSQTSPPEISKFNGTDYTCITFFPDLDRFKMDSLDEDTVALLSKRVLDVAGTNNGSGPKLNVFLNGNKIEARTFEQYIGMYRGLEPAVFFEKVSDRWEIGVGVSDGSFQQVSFVNSICTIKGGCHVNYIADQITSRLMAVVKKKNKGEEVKANQIKNHLCVFVNCLVVNPAFDSQTKENLTTKQSALGSVCTVSDKMMKRIEQSAIIDNILNWSKFKQTVELKKKGGSKRSKVLGITKLDDANCAGTSKSIHCTLILTEGDSAKALAISGLGVVGRDYYGVFPLKGKLLNVREASHQQILKNEEIQNVAKILGLTFGKEYDENSIKDLRYGHLMIMTDQDHDGSHIKGLLINFIHHFWPSLLKVDGFLQQFITPIVKVSKGKRELTFYTIPEYTEWKKHHDDGKGWKIKYYKGLGTSTAAEAKEYFSNLKTHQINFKWDDRASDMIDMAFAKKRVDDRKLWLLSMEQGVYMDYKVESISYDDFINHELILFSNADNERSIPHFMDGLKPSQRKVLFSCFKRNLKQEIKVAQLAGYVSEHSAYHHGEASLTQTIINMAQNYVGSNNINLLSPCGQFGTRLMGGKDAASPRYVFTKLEAVTRCIFHPDDDALLDYLDDDGQSIEPTFYVPIIPMALVNGSEGIGTGWSCSIPSYNPRDIINNLRSLITSKLPEDIQPWYKGFTGIIQAKSGSNFSMFGIIEQVDESTVLISELPVGKWTCDYKQFLESAIIGGAPAAKDDTGPTIVPFIKDFKENHTDTTVSFTVSMPPEKLTEILNDDKGGLMKKFKLESTVATTNMHMFDLNSQIRKYDGYVLFSCFN